MASEAKSPQDVLGTSDPGDDVQLRFRYQAIFAAKLALGILVPETQIVEIYCEHHGDVLVKMSDGAFRCCQVKTRLPGLGPFKSDDQAIVETLSRFVGLEQQFPGHFDRFVVAVNCGFWSKDDGNEQNPHCLISRACEALKTGKLSTRGTLARIVEALKIKHKCESKTVLSTMCKVKLHERFPSFESAPKDLVFDIRSTIRKDTTLDRLSSAAEELVNLVIKASSLAISSSLAFYFAMFDNPVSAEEQDKIAGKRITKETVAAALAKAIAQQPLLTSNGAPRLVQGFSKAEQKFTAGGVSAENTQSIKDFQDSLELLLDEWGYKYDFDEANRRYNHLRLIVREQCLDAEASTRIPLQAYGTPMLQTVRRNLTQRYQIGLSDFQSLNCKYEHLLGIVGDLTDTCDVWWSDEFKVS